MAGDPLGGARSALEHGRLKKAVRLAWDAGFNADRRSDAAGLEAVLAVLAAVVERDPAGAAGAAGGDAAKARGYFTTCLEEVRSGVPRKGLFAGLFGVGRGRHAGAGAAASPAAAPATKACPDCAEQILEAARVCRFCGFRYPA